MSVFAILVNALQNPPAIHIACTKLTVPAVDDLLRDLRTAVNEVKAMDKAGGGSMVTLYGLGSGSPIGPGLVEEMASRCECFSTQSWFRILLELTVLIWLRFALSHRHGCRE